MMTSNSRPSLEAQASGTDTRIEDLPTGEEQRIIGDSRDSEALLEAVAHADSELQDFLGQSREQFDALRLERLRKMTEASKAGHTHAEIGDAIGMSRSRVSRILNAPIKLSKSGEELLAAWSPQPAGNWTPRGGAGQRRRS